MKVGFATLLFLGCLLVSQPANGVQSEASPEAPSAVPWVTEQPGFRPNLTYPICYTLVLQGIGAGFVSAFGQEEKGYTGPSWNNFVDAFTKGPRPDDDPWYLNYVGHPLSGSETYLRARAQGCSWLGSFLFSTAASVVWEFGIESWYHRPSSQDLIVTPLAGSVIGEGRFQLKRALLSADTDSSKLLVVIIDPIQSFAEVIGRAMGKDWTEPAFRKTPSTASQLAPLFITSLAPSGNHLSVSVQCRISF